MPHDIIEELDLSGLTEDEVELLDEILSDFGDSRRRFLGPLFHHRWPRASWLLGAS